MSEEAPARIDDETLVSRSDDQVSARLDDEIVLMNTQNGKYFRMDEVASDIWASLEEPTSMGALVTLLAEQYDDPDDRLRDDVAAFVQRLAELGIVDVDQSAGE